MPLKMLNLIVETTEDSFNLKSRTRLKEVASKMSDQMRTVVLEDIGNPTLKQVCLNMITKLRLESALLDEAKEGPVVYQRNTVRNEPVGSGMFDDSGEEGNELLTEA